MGLDRGVFWGLLKGILGVQTAAHEIQVGCCPHAVTVRQHF